jgi:hypothetical protein
MPQLQGVDPKLLLYQNPARLLAGWESSWGNRTEVFSMKSDENKPLAPASRRTLITSLAALGSAALASSCCLPLFPFLAAAGAAGTSAVFVTLRPFLVAASLLLVAFGFYQAWRAKQCKRRQSVSSGILLWLSALIVLVFTLFPQAAANFVADLLAR